MATPCVRGNDAEDMSGSDLGVVAADEEGPLLPVVREELFDRQGGEQSGGRGGGWKGRARWKKINWAMMFGWAESHPRTDRGFPPGDPKEGLK